MSRAEVFDRNRPLLFSIAYRMAGSVMEAEDAVQEAYLRWQRASEDEVRYRQRSARARREQYVGPRLPEPVLGGQAEKLGNVPPLEREEESR